MLEIVEPPPDLGKIEKPKVKRAMTEYQLANLQKGRDVRKANGEEKRRQDAQLLEDAVKKKTDELLSKTVRQAEYKIKRDAEIQADIQAKAEAIAMERINSKKEKKSSAKKQVIVLDDESGSDSDSDGNPPQIVIRRSKPKKVEKVEDVAQIIPQYVAPTRLKRA